MCSALHVYMLGSIVESLEGFGKTMHKHATSRPPSVHLSLSLPHAKLFYLSFSLQQSTNSLSCQSKPTFMQQIFNNTIHPTWSLSPLIISLPFPPPQNHITIPTMPSLGAHMSTATTQHQCHTSPADLTTVSGQSFRTRACDFFYCALSFSHKNLTLKSTNLTPIVTNLYHTRLHSDCT